MTDDRYVIRPYFRAPSIDPAGSRIAFVYAGDIWLVDVSGGQAERLTAHPANHMLPRWSPDGSAIAYTSSRTGQGDVYVLPLNGGEVRRITYHEAQSAVECWSPDGAAIYFTSQRERQGAAIYRIAASGGTPVRWIAQPYERLGTVAVSPCGRWLAFSLMRDLWWRRGPNPYGGAELWLVSNAPDADDFFQLSDAPGMNYCPMWSPDSQLIFFVSDRDGSENLWVAPREGGVAERITAFTDGRLLWPSISADGRMIAFERDFGIWTLDLASGATTRVPIQVRQDTKVTPVRVQTYTRDAGELALSPDGKKVAFTVRGKIFADFAEKETERDQRHGPAYRISHTAFRDSDIAWSPDSRRLVYVSDRHGDEEVYCYDFLARSETRLTFGAKRKSAPCFSPDGRWIAYASGDDEIRLIEVSSGEDRPFIRAYFVFGASFAWSPDSRWLAFCAQDERFFSNVYVQHIEEEQAHQISFLSNLQAAGPLWSPDGRFLVFTTGQYRAESQIARIDLQPQPPVFRETEFERLFELHKSDCRDKQTAGPPSTVGPPHTRSADADREPQPMVVPVIEPDDESDRAARQHNAPSRLSRSTSPSEITIVFNGIERRLRLLTPPQMDAIALCISPDGRDLVCSATIAGRQNLWTLPLDEPRAGQGPRQLTSTPGTKSCACFTPDGKQIYFLDGGTIALRKFPKGEQTTLPVSAEVVVDFTQEKRQIFEECWRLLRDCFYDERFRGIDWKTIHDRYAPLIQGAQTPPEVYLLINLMVGELRSSHVGLFRSDGNGGQDGYLGITLDTIEYLRSGQFRVAGVIPDGPAAVAHNGALQPGDVLLAVNGVALKPETSLDALLQRTAGQRVILRVVNPAGEQRDVEVRPITAEQYDWLRYRAWVLENEQIVHRASNGRIGYVHIRKMSYDAYQQFLTDLDVEMHNKEGLVVDIRFNSGGHTATFILDVLMRRSVLFSAFRNRSVADSSHIFGNRVLNKPTVLVTNEASSSNAETFSESYRRQGLGKVVGKPTAGAVIGTFTRLLIDGTSLRLPQLRVTTPEGEELEGRGRPVDVDVPLRLGEWRYGRDAQLEAAVRVLLADLDGPDHHIE
ncbi:S41 family peptidase [Roseiflexus castenholzii]|uniref:Tricorn protease homolog n=1 Tax=Roseiflexus castenholzii (strain DSM 13941 / HLO8) TaxID=383372 RepID=A7NNR3_ROSCS|nr:LpqB family beta-propeller domain-containing protein [Roseiflexus castenholzii]ABU59207.1 peptidase S41 [Roseiflexus castenholzii DSM 13941]